MKITRPPGTSRWWDIPSILILLVILTTAFTRLSATNWSENLDAIRMISYIGFLAGLALGYSRFSPRQVAFFVLVYGTFTVPWRIGLSLGEDIAWLERLQSMAGRLGVILWYLLQQRAAPDNFLFVTLMSILFWFTSVHAGYTLVRYANPWVVALPSGVAIVLIQTYDPHPRRVWGLIIYLFLALLLVARLDFVNRRKRWEQNHTYIPSYLGTDFLRFALVACLLLIALSWATPALAKALPAAKTSWDRVVTPWWNDVRNVFENAFSSLRSSIGLTGEYYGPNLSLGRGNILSDTVIFTVQAPGGIPAGVRYYWRARVYDTYEKIWISSLQTTRALDAQEIDLKFPDLSDNPPRTPSFTFYLSRPLATILAPNHPVWLSRPSRAEFSLNPDGTVDLGMLRATPSLRGGEIYSVRSSFNVVTVEELRQAGTDYPSWVTARYLQLPTSITIRTRQLAAQIAENKETPYDRAQAITQYLRENYQYTETVPALPSNQELIDWFLFDLKQGFCNYYATAEVVLLRSLGIPARLAVGYASGENVDDPEFYTVRQLDAHAWPEVYFPEIGWVEFEPTVSQPELSRPLTALGQDNLNNLSSSNLDREDPEPEPPTPRNTLDNPFERTNIWQERLYIIIIAGLFAIMIALLIPLIRRKQLHKRIPFLSIALEKALLRAGLKPPAILSQIALMASLSPLERAYQQINLALVRLGKRPHPTNTPTERTNTLINRLPPSKEPAQLVLTEYQNTIYSQRGLTNQIMVQRAGQEIRRLSLRAYIRRRFGV